MLSLFNKRRSSQTQTTDLELGMVVVSTDSTVANQAPSNELPGLRAALIRAHKGVALPQIISAHNAVTSISAIGNLATDIYALVTQGFSEDDHFNEETRKVAVAASTAPIILSNGLQISEFIKEQKRIQLLQRNFLGSISHLITDCYFMEAPDKRIDATALDVDTMMRFMYDHGSANFTLSVPGADFILIDNSFTARSGKVLMLAVGTSLAATGLSISSKLGALVFSSDPVINNAVRMGTSVIANAPIVDAAGSLLRWSKSQNRLMLEAIAKVIDVVYIKPNIETEGLKKNAAKIPRNLLKNLNGYVTEQEMDVIEDMREDALKESKNTPRLSNG